ncbi:MAG: nucleoside deaminase [Chloroflexota bacterium]
MSNFDALDHAKFMHEALNEAAMALQQEEIPIGAVVVHNGKIVGRGRAQHRKRHSEIAHAELNALIQAEKYIQDHTHECIVYTTVEPCVMCLGAIVMSDIDHVVFGVADKYIYPDQKLMVLPYVQRHIKNYLGGVLEMECRDLIAKHSHELLDLLAGFATPK